MRLTCPNCGARYEVADSMVPPEGRDVQCSNCSTTWFQPGRRTDRTAAAQPEPSGRMAPPPEPPVASAPPERAPAPQPAPQDEDAIAAAVSATVTEAGGQPDPEPPATPQPRRREISPDLRSILKEEAEREARLRRAEADPVETQEEMSLADEPAEAVRARRRAELEAAQDAFETDGPGTQTLGQAARNLFPDIDEINSTLRDTGDRSGAEADASDIDTLDAGPRRRQGVRLGFLLAVALAVGGGFLYANAERVATQVPALAPTLDGYVGTVNSARFWLDDMAQRLGSIAGEG
jgi:predicted Zn finger-like uncharacterized protein